MIYITTVPSTLHLSQIKWIYAFHNFLLPFINWTTQHTTVTASSLYESNLVCSMLWRIDIKRIYSLIEQNLKTEWSIQITCIQKIKYETKSENYNLEVLTFEANKTKIVWKFSMILFHHFQSKQ